MSSTSFCKFYLPLKIRTCFFLKDFILLSILIQLPACKSVSVFFNNIDIAIGDIISPTEKRTWGCYNMIANLNKGLIIRL